MRRPSTPLERLQRGLYWGAPAAVALAAATAYAGVRLSSSAAEVLTAIEIEMLGFTLVVLSFLSLFTAQSFSTDADKISKAFTNDTDRLLTENRTHWQDQSSALKAAVGSLEKAVALLTSSLEATQSAMQLTRSLVEIERERDRLQQQEREMRTRTLQPRLGVLVAVPSGGVQVKHLTLHVLNVGGEARKLAVFFGITGTRVDESHCDSVGYYKTQPFDFGDISGWPPDATFEISVEASDIEERRYRYVARVSYSRNKALVVSYPAVEPSEWQFPEPMIAT